MRKLISMSLALIMMVCLAAYPMTSAASTTSNAKNTITQKKVTKKKVIKKKQTKKKAVKKKTASKPTPTPKTKTAADSKEFPVKPIILPTKNTNTTPKPAATPIPGWIPPTIPGYDVVIPLQSLPTENVLNIGEVGLVTFSGMLSSNWRLQISDTSMLQLNSSASILNSKTGLYENTWCLKALKDGYVKVLFINEANAGINGITQMAYYIRIGNPIFVTMPPRPTEYPKPTDFPKLTPYPQPTTNTVLLNPLVQNVLKVGDFGVVKMPMPVPDIIWTYKIDNPSIIDISPKFNLDSTYLQAAWSFTALNPGSTTITFTGKLINGSEMPTNQTVVFKVTVNKGEIIVPTPKPTEQPRPTPTPNNIIDLYPNVENFLKVGDTCEVSMPQICIYPPYLSDDKNGSNIEPLMPIYNGLIWTCKIDDTSIIDYSKDMAIIAIYPQNIWYFQALKQGSTTITFIGNPSNPMLKMASQVLVYKVTVVDGDMIVTPPVLKN